ncbi:D-aminoacylase [Phototrophicus methaneseepsis]|uniref:D-aminoacylase n=1 Tax=Phototrophicus methaneseepsis TaxID=2710758 RepID=A0A7S8E8S9_9CHLR|nr:D-aminoacylase [Phototrophicus methaneseepsis]QPC82479.1 D-aminoacylase [Phototrophicus methaneseepsis]
MTYDIVLRGGSIYDGTGDDPIVGDIAIQGDRIAEIGAPGTLEGDQIIDVDGLAVAPGFINMLSWATESLIEDGRSQSDIRQGVTLEVMGEGTSMGPLSPEMKKGGDFILTDHVDYEIEWDTLGEYLQFLEDKGVSTNVASFVGTGTLRIYAMGYEDRDPTAEELETMKRLVKEAMEEGAMGMSAALIYPPAAFAKTEEIIELAKIVGEYNGLYISHIRGEGRTLDTSLEEFLRIVREANVSGEVYHIKAAGRANWSKMDDMLAKIEEVRAEGLPVTADMYTYAASGTGLASCLPNWAHDGGHNALMERLRDPETREHIISEMQRPSEEWENMYAENSPENILLMGFKNEALRKYSGKRLSEVIKERGTGARETVLDLLLEDDSRIFTIYFTMSEDNLRKEVVKPWVSFCSDAGSYTDGEPFTHNPTHPRAYGSFIRVLGKYVREEGLLTLQEAVRKLAALPADTLKLTDRGYLKPGYFADVVVFDPETVQDHATFEQPHQYATGMKHVFVNGGQVLRDGEHTGAMPGRFVKGPGYTGGDA